MNKVPQTIEDAEDEGENGNPFSGNDPRMQATHNQEAKAGMDWCRRNQRPSPEAPRYGCSNSY